MADKASPIDDELVLTLKRGVRGLYSRFQSERPEGAPGDGAMLVLGRVQRLGRATMGELSAYFGVSGASMHQSVRALQRGGYVRRAKDPQDGRRVLVETTESGERLAVRSRAVRDAWLRSRLEALTDEDLEQLRRAAGLMVRIATDRDE